ncbi:MAG TPA: 16S rRNA (cytosine(1402)-N(4))-methyltransferase RsmH [Bacteroidia bacterium]|nr:16S rRNA (cytosine(1402)-N(4))-methyltransferase RsmH [Bacteroidia bacterium]
MENEFHHPVLLKESVEGLNVKKDGVYVDATFGGGGHSKEILRLLADGQLFGFEQDEDAWKNKINDKRFILVKHNFRNIKNALKEHEVEKVDGLLADLGVSSHQFDTAGRGFSTRFDAELDMRMSKETERTAADILNEYESEELKKIFKEFGELGNASAIVKVIIIRRERKKILHVSELKEILKGLAKHGKENQFFARLFQALRIEVNDELNALKKLLEQSSEIIKKEGRLVVISYHSLEDRLVKNFIRSGKFEGEAKKDFYGNRIIPFKQVNKKIIQPGENEIKNNPRARSAKLRIAEKL